MSRPGKEHWQGVKRILRYIQGTIDFGLIYKAKGNTCSLTGYSDADWAGDLDTRCSTSGYVFQIDGSTASKARDKYVYPNQQLKQNIWHSFLQHKKQSG